MEERYSQLLDNLSDKEFVTIDKLAEKLQLSPRTIRTLLNELEEELLQNGCELRRERNKGAKLDITNLKKYEIFYKKTAHTQIPNSGEQRIDYILALFFSTHEFIKIDDLCDQLFVSRKTVSMDLKSVEEYLNRYQIALERKPYYGIKMRGDEFAFRLCLSSIFYERDHFWFRPIYDEFEEPEIIRKQLLESTQKLGYTIYETDISNMVLQIQIALYRFKMGAEISMEEVDSKEWLQESDIKVAKMCALGLENTVSMLLPISEIKYLAIHLSGKKKLLTTGSENLVIDREVNQLVNEMLENVHKVFNLDLTSDFELNTSLKKHMVALRIRLQYHLKLENPILKEIKEEYSFPYAVATQAATVLSEYFHVMVSEDEIGYLAVCFALSLERHKQSRKRNILLVCASGEGTSKLFEYRFKETFKDYLNTVETCDITSLPTRDFSQIDYIFTTVPIPFPIPVAIYQVQYFFDKHNFNQVKWILEDHQLESIKQYFSEDLFFTDIEGENREEIIHALCERIGEVREIPEKFEESVLYREKIMQTDFNGQIAIPHPYKPITSETFVCVAVLDKPVRWYNCDVQVIFLLSISDKNEVVENFYRVTSKFMMDETFINQIITEKNFETILEIIDNVENYAQEK